MLSQDQKIFEPGAARARIVSYGTIFNELTLVVFGVGKRRENILAKNVKAISVGGVSKTDSFFKGLRETSLLAYSMKADVISVQDPFFIGCAGLLAAYRAHISLHVQVHTDFMNASYAFSSMRKFFEIPLAYFVLSQAACVRVVSQRIARSLWFVPRRKLSILPIPPAPMRDVRRLSLGRGTGGFSVLVVSRLEPEKRVHLALNAFAKWVTSDVTHSRGAMLIIVGDGGERARLENRARNLGIAEQVRFMGRQDDLAPLYAKADIFLQLSRFEGYGLSLIEAGLAGLPIITTDVGVVGEVYESGRDALVVSGAPQDVAAALRRLAGDSALRNTLGARAIERAQGTLIARDEYLRRYRESFAECAKNKQN